MIKSLIDTELWKLKVDWKKHIGEDLVENGCGHSGLQTLKLVVSQVAINGINWLLVCSYKFRKGQSFFVISELLWSKKWHILLGHGTIKSAVFQEWIDKTRWFLACWYKIRKAESCCNNYWVGIVKSRWVLVDHGTLKIRYISQMIWWIAQIDWMIFACWY